ncbi:LLM class flavin-dependent oxidoreductase [Leucobacter weissii]|uniref:LLM class flavin-dependent oxidoreductase n=1 Tax=Leucobacter weissii TaxID=1983706 RepID=A0A939MK31_9MICO|nr:LLM class flavin-dependent oxidoreductase [Leucobacter weissii]MBO1901425.1 LLM class flavin-dependent oxidoreductase [Leucobacter weissii]
MKPVLPPRAPLPLRFNDVRLRVSSSIGTLSIYRLVDKLLIWIQTVLDAGVSNEARHRYSRGRLRREAGVELATRVSFGLNYDFTNPSRERWTDHYRGILEQIEWIDRELPFDRIDVTEHHFYENGYLPSPLVMLGIIAARTRRVNLGSDVIQLPLHNPVRLAEESLIIDAVSGGRLRLGVGMGYYQQEFHGLGIDLKHRLSRTLDSLEILRLAFAGERFTYSGRRFELPEIEVTPLPIRDGGPEIWMGGEVAPAIRRAAKYADGFLVFSPNGLDEYPAAARELGRPESDIRMNRTYWAIIADDPEREFARVGENWLRLVNDYVARGHLAPEGKGRGRRPDFKTPREAYEMGLLFLTDAAGAIDTFNADIDRGVTDFDIMPVMPGEDIDRASERLEYLAAHVLPHLKLSEHPSAGRSSAPALGAV